MTTAEGWSSERRLVHVFGSAANIHETDKICPLLMSLINMLSPWWILTPLCILLCKRFFGASARLYAGSPTEEWTRRFFPQVGVQSSSYQDDFGSRLTAAECAKWWRSSCHV